MHSDTTEMRLERRISAVYKYIPGGQLLGPTYDYTHRLLDFTLLANGEAPTLTTADSEQQPSPHVFSLLARQGLAKFEEDSGAQPDDITRTPPVYPCSRSSRLQQLMRGDEGYLLALAYSTQRGYGRNHPFAGEIRSGYIDVSIVPEELGFAVNVGELLMTECEMVRGMIATEIVREGNSLLTQVRQLLTTRFQFIVKIDYRVSALCVLFRHVGSS